MPLLKVMGFDGLIPRESPTMLGDSQAQQADNVKLYSKELRYWRGPLFTHDPEQADIRTIYKWYTPAPDPIWLTWQTVVNVAPSPLADTVDYRLYYTGDGAPKKTNYTRATSGSGSYPQAYYEMGVPAPIAAPTVNVTSVTAATLTLFVSSNVAANDSSSGVNTTGTFTVPVTTGAASADYIYEVTPDVETRSYVYTYLSTFGTVTEESAPSPPSTLIDVSTSQGVVVTGFSVAPTTNYNITGIRLYRTVTGATTDSYQFVADLAVSATTYTDTLTPEQLGAVLSSTGWAPPPADLQGLLPLPNGSMVGFTGNTVYFSEPYHPHAWPAAYALSVPYAIVGLGIYGTSVVVATERYPYVMNGYSPGAMSSERVPILEPCVSAASIASDEYGVLYASPNGMVGIGQNIRGLITQALFRRDEWQALNPQNLYGVIVDGKYFGIYPNSPEDQKTLVISRDDVPALSYLATRATAAHVDNKNTNLYFVSSVDDKIYQLDADELNPVTFEWQSKRFVLPQATSFSALKVDADYDQAQAVTDYNERVAEIQAANAIVFASGNLDGALNTTTLNTYDVNGSAMQNVPPLSAVRTVQVFIYGDEELVSTSTLSSFDPIRLAPFKSRVIEVKITGTLNVRSMTMATTVPELHQ